MELHWRQGEKSCHWEHLLLFHAQFESQVNKMPDQKWNKKISLSVTGPSSETQGLGAVSRVGRNGGTKVFK